MRTPRILTAVALVAPALAVGLVSSAVPASAGPGDFEERWCSTSPAPCLESAERNGALLTSTDPDFDVEMTGKLMSDGDPYFQWLVNDKDLGGGASLQTTDEWELVFDTGTMKPTYTEAYAGKPDVDAFVGADGANRLSYDAKPVITTEGCNSGMSWPWFCTHTASSWTTELSGEVWERTSGGTAWEGFHRSQSAEGVNGVFLEKAPDGSRFLSSEMVNSHQFVDGSSMRTFKGEVRFRLPYTMLKEHFEVPDPKTMVTSSLTGTINGSPSKGTWNVFHDPDGGGMIVDVSDITFSLNRLKVRRGDITPTKPTPVSAWRTSARRGFVDFDPSDPRGARVTGYQGSCAAANRDHVVTSTAERADSRIYFAGLRRGVAYECKVRATSKIGASKWSKATVPGQITLPV